MSSSIATLVGFGAAGLWSLLSLLTVLTGPVPPFQVLAVTFFVGSALAGAAGTMAGAYYGSVWYFMGFIIGLKAFTAAVIGGIGSIPGAMLGGLVLGLLESFGTQIPGIGSEWKDVFSFSVLILVLVFKPTGLLGKSEQERM